MADYFNDDFRDFIRALNNQQVEYILVGGMAVVLHGYVRTTGGMDIWVKRTNDNYRKIVKAFHEFRMPVFDMTEEQFLSDQYDVWMFGVEPVKIELMTSVKVSILMKLTGCLRYIQRMIFLSGFFTSIAFLLRKKPQDVLKTLTIFNSFRKEKRNRVLPSKVNAS